MELDNGGASFHGVEGGAWLYQFGASMACRPLAVLSPAQVGPSGLLRCRSSVVLDWNPVRGVSGDIHYEWKLVGPLGKTEGSSNESQKKWLLAAARAIPGKCG